MSHRSPGPLDLAPLLAALCLLGCDPAAPDGGVDASQSDAGQPDAGVMDAASPEPDAGRVPEDAGAGDAGVTDDAGPADACVPDCDARDCGDDGCGGDCGVCAAGATCTPAGACVAQQSSCTFVAPAASSCVDGFPSRTAALDITVTDAQGDPIRFTVCYDIGAGLQPATITTTDNGSLSAYTSTNPAVTCVGASNQVIDAAAGSATITWDFGADGVPSSFCEQATVVVFPEDGSPADAGGFFRCDQTFGLANNGPPTATVTSVSDSEIRFDLMDPDSALISVLFEYTIDGGASWFVATPGGGESNPTTISPGAGASWAWDSAADVGVCTAGVLIRVSASDGVPVSGRPTQAVSSPTSIGCP